jgi:iron complex transport system substrate-binding protein
MSLSPSLRRWTLLRLCVAVAAMAGGLSSGSLEACAATPAAQHDVTFKDDVGRSVTVHVPIRRTVVFNRYTTEFIRAVAGMSVVVGDDIDPGKDADYWPTVTRAMMAGTQGSPNFEAIVAMHPDVVFMPRNSDFEAAQKALKPFGIPVAVLTGWDVLKHEQNVTLIGQLYAQPDKAAKLNAFYRRYRDLLSERLKGVKRKRVYMEEVGDYKTLLPGSGWHDMIQTAGGLNVFGDVDILKQSSARGSVQGFTVDPEEIIARQPDVIIKLEPGQLRPHLAAFSKGVLDGIAARPGFASLPAVKSGQVYHMSYYLAGACSKIIGALQVAKWLYPNRLRDVDPNEVMGVWLRDFQGVTPPGGYWRSLADVGR